MDVCGYVGARVRAGVAEGQVLSAMDARAGQLASAAICYTIHPNRQAATKVTVLVLGPAWLPSTDPPLGSSFATRTRPWFAQSQPTPRRLKDGKASASAYRWRCARKNIWTDGGSD